MSLIKSISGIRGTIGGKYGSNLTPLDIVECCAAFGAWVKQRSGKAKPKIIIGRDARISGEMVSSLACAALVSVGVEVIDLGLSTTPTVEIAVVAEGAAAGIVITASHNPKEWNALKLLNERGEFISASDGEEVLAFISGGGIAFSEVDKLGSVKKDDTYIQKHIQQVLNLSLVDAEAVRTKAFKVIVDCINSTGAISVAPLLEALGCKVTLLNGAMTGQFAHNPEPLPENLNELSKAVLSQRADLGIAVDPDVDRLAFVCEDGEMFGEEYTLVAVADYVLQHRPGATVSNLSSTRALKEITEKRGGRYESAAVGEVNVVTKMKEINAVIGGEGNGGVILPELHYGRDALAGIALLLTSLAKFGKPVSFLREKLPSYVIVKKKLELHPDHHIDDMLNQLSEKYKKYNVNRIDGLKITFDSGDWIHMRKSNTEPIIRVYAESPSEVISNNLIQKVNQDIYEIINAERIRLTES